MHKPKSFPIHRRHFAIQLLLLVSAWFATSYLDRKVSAKDYLLTIGGGYEPAGNQASIEANVLFFQRQDRDEAMLSSHWFFQRLLDYCQFRF